jgi:trigger factor
MAKKFQENEISVQVSGGEGCTKDICVEIALERFRDEKSAVLREMIKEIALPGFRKGKVPPDVVEKRFADEIHAEAIKSILPLAYEHLVASEGLEPLGDPRFHDIQAETDKPLTFRVSIEVAPKLEIRDYRGVSVEREAVDVTDEEIEEVVRNLQQRSADYTTVGRPAAAGDLVVLDFGPVGKDGAVNEKKRVTNYPVQLGAGQIFAEFEQAITGKGAGEQGRVEIAYPKDYEPARLAGRTVLYDFAVREVRERKLPELNDELAGKIDSKFKSMADLRADVRERLRAEKEREALRRRQERAVDVILERNPFDVPVSMRERFEAELRREDEQRRESMGAGPEQDEERKKQIDQLFKRIAIRNIKRYFLFEHIAEREGISVSDAEIQGELQRIADESGESVEEIRKIVMKDRDKLSNLTHRIFEKKIFEVILGGSDMVQ